MNLSEIKRPIENVVLSTQQSKEQRDGQKRFSERIYRDRKKDNSDGGRH